MDKLRVGIIGATGLVGNNFIKLLEKHPWFKIEGVYASHDSLGKKVSGSDADRSLALEVQETDVQKIISEKFDIIYNAVSEKEAGKIERELEKGGQHVFTNASANRLREDVPLVVPEINLDHLDMIKNKKGYIIANGNCSTIGLTLGVDPIMNLNPKDLVVTTLQSVSGAGHPGTSALDILGNIVPYISGEEEKIVNESRKIWGKLERNKIRESPLEINATTTRVPVHTGHLETISVRFDSRRSLEEIRQCFESYGSGKIRGEYPTLPKTSIRFMDEIDRPQPILDVNQGFIKGDAVKEMQISVGRARVNGNRVSFIIMLNNLIRGAAGASILNSEIIAKEEGWV
jgi:aspartate-semialdehyde dehydrogenase